MPRELADSLRARGLEPVIVGIDGEADPTLSDLGAEFVNWGRIGKLIATFKSRGCTQLVILGSVSRPDLGSITPDFGLFRALPTVLRLVRAGGDDAILRGVIAFLEERGLRVVGPASLAPEMLIGEGPFGAVAAPDGIKRDIATGFGLIAALAPFDVGQAAVITEGGIEAIEGNEGTDRMLARVARARRIGRPDGDPRTRGCLVKRTKPGQELRVDMPVIGPRTVTAALEANLTGIAVEAGRVLAAERTELRARANRTGLFITGWNTETVYRGGAATSAPVEFYRAERRGRIRLSNPQSADAIIGAQIANALEPYSVGRAIVISRRHVLAVGASETPIETVARAAELRQWGDKRWQKRAGVAVLGAGRDADTELIERVAAAGLAGLGIRLSKFAAPVRDDVVATADRLGLFIAALAPGN